ncbi:MAG: hypothetical protein JW940_39585 [Polyangiaceae bacterium]|nr:hypothetical protein [Polyangiaceae bacterium]
MGFPLLLDGLTIESADASDPGTRSIALLAVDSPAVTLSHLTLRAGRGADGQDAQGFTEKAPSGTPGNIGQDACSPTPTGAAAAETDCGDGVKSIGGKGGDGANATPPPSAPADGADGTPLSPPNQSSTNPNAGTAQTSTDECTNGGDGCGGQGGPGGRGGGASIALALVHSPLTLSSVSLHTENGGKGGQGAKGQVGGIGGPRGGNGTASSGDPDACDGGSGGDGGDGGPGSGGSGGPSLGIGIVGDAPTQTAVTSSLSDTPAPGGLDGTAAPSDSQGPDGPVAEQLELQLGD